MLIYICIFLVSSLFIYFSERIIVQKKEGECNNSLLERIKYSNRVKSSFLSEKRILSNILVAISLILPIILAAIRSPEIGTDVQYYVIPHFNAALRCESFFIFSRRFDFSFTSEPIYQIILFIVTRLSNNYHSALFIYQAIIIVFVYLGFRNFNKIFSVPIWLGMLLFYFMYYNVSLNIIRQSMAVSVIFFAVSCLFNGNKLSYFLFVLIAFCLHGSGVLGLVFFPMYILLKKEDRGLKYNDIIKIFVITTCLGAIIINLDKIVRFAVNIGLVRSNMLNYLSDGRFSSNYLSPVSVGIYSLLLFAYIIHTKYVASKQIELNFFTIISLIMLFGAFGSLVSLYISRVCYYFIPFQAFALSSIQRCYKKNSKVVWNLIVISFIFSTWIVFFIIKNNHSTYPYMIDISLFYD